MACNETATSPESDAPAAESQAQFKSASGGGNGSAKASARLQQLNRELAQAGANFALARGELALSPTADPDRALIVFANDRMLRLTSRWVPGDPRRDADGANLTYLVYQALALANGSVDSEPSIDSAFDTWGAISCGNLPLVKRSDTGADPSAFSTTGNPFLADVVNLGFLPGFVFDAYLEPGASESVLGVTWTFIFGSYDAELNFIPSDIDGNGLADTALKEVWYNDEFDWNADGVTDIDNTDIETVAFHENGHSLELGHFGKIAGNTSSGYLVVAPRAAMNAIILGTLRSPLGTDNAAYCGNWAQWPSN
jgi:hypothetical protein